MASACREMTGVEILDAVAEMGEWFAVKDR